MLASDLNNPEFVGAINPDSLLTVQFYSKPIKNDFKSKLEGRLVCEDVEFVKIWTPGNQLNIIDRPVNEDDKHRFFEQWKRYEAGKQGGEQQNGTPLKEWGLLTPAQAEELRYLKFFTVDQIAGCSDDNALRLTALVGMSGYALRDRAKNWLAASKGEAVATQMAEQNKQLQDQMADLQAQLLALQAGQQDQKRGPGRPKLTEQA